ncbi:MAG: hypothetical protein ACOYM1_11630 [Methylovulum sp.]
MEKFNLVASSNDNNSSYSFSPSELYVDLDGNCYEETYSSRQYAEEHGGDSWEDAGRIEAFFENGYWQVTGDEIRKRFEQFKGRSHAH